MCTLATFVASPESARAALPSLPPAPTVTPLKDSKGVPGVLNLSGGLQQTTSAVGQVVSAVQALGVALQGTTAPDVQSQVAALQASVAQVQADIAALDTGAAQADLMAAVSSIEGQVLALGLTTGLTSGLSIAQDVLSPVCALTAVPTSFVPGLGADLSRTYKLASPTIQQTDAKTDALIKQVYDTVYNEVLALLGANATTAAVPALLQLLQFNWTTTYQAPDGTRITKTAPGLINLPTPIDVDNSGTFDVCAMASYALDPSGAVVMKETITKMPLAKATLPLSIDAGLLANVLHVGYDTTTQPAFDTDASAADNSASTAPVSYTATTTYASSGTKFDTAVAVHRGTTLTLPPVDFNPLPALPTIPPLTEPAPTPKLTQNFCLLACTTLDLTNRYDNEPNTMHVTTVTPSASAENLRYTGDAKGDLYSLNYAVLGGLSTVVSKAAPAPGTLSYCASATTGACASSPHSSTDKGSLLLSSNLPIHFDNYAKSGGTPNTTCTARAADVHVDGTRLALSNAPIAGSNPGKVFVDTAGKPLSGCVGYAASVTGIPAGSFPGGFAASGRDSTYHASGSTQIPDAKAGAVTCPDTTAFTLGAATALTPVVCPVLPTLTGGPTISGDPIAESPLAATSTWSPVADSPTVANSPTHNYQWQRCDETCANCGPVSGATNAVYLPVYGDGPGGTTTDIGHAFRVVVTGTNLDGSFTSLASPATAPVVDQSAAPTNTVLPTITGVAGTGHTLTAHSSKSTDWTGGISSALAYQWQKCDASGTPASCADIAGATDSTYNVAYPTDLDSTIQVVVTATNHIGSTPATSAQQRIQPAPINTVVGVIQRCINSACSVSSDIPAGSAPFTGDKLKVTDGTWQAGTETALAYQWMRCDADGTNCANIDGATTNRYTVSKANDLGKTLKVDITGTNDNRDDTNAPVKTTVTTALTAVVTPAKPAVQIASAVDGAVNSVATSGHDTTYLGGSFDTAGPAAGGAGAEVLTAGSTQGSVVNGAGITGGVVKAITSDLTGGYFIGGTFDKVQGQSCVAFAHITSAGALDNTYCNLGGITGEVRAVAVASTSYAVTTADTVYRVAVGGLFNAGGHHNFMYVNTTTKDLTFESAGDPNGAVNVITPHGAIFAVNLASVTQQGKVYFGGDFTKLGNTVVANHIARDNWGGSTAAPTITYDAAFVPQVCTGAPVSGECATASVKTIALAAQSTLLTLPVSAPAFIMVGGSFDGAYKATDAPSARGNAAAFSTTAPGAPTTWNPNTNGPVNAIGLGYGGSASIPYAVFLGGSFTHAGAASPGGVDVTNAVAYGITSTGATSTAPATQMNGAPSTSWKPSLDGPVYAISAGPAASSYIALGGSFKNAEGAARNRIALYLNQTSAATAGPTLQPLTAHAGNDVYALGRDASSRLLAGGAFKVLGGAVRKNVAEISQASGVTSWTANTDGPVTAVGANSDTVYLAGSFSAVNNTARNGLAGVKQADSTVTGFTPSLSPGGVVNVLTASDDAVYAGGNFTGIGGSARNSLAQLDPATGNATSWNSGGVTGNAGTVTAIVLDGSNVLVGGSFTNTGGATRNNAAAINTAGAATGWDPSPDGAVNAIAVDPDNTHSIFLGGAFANVGGAARTNVANVDDTAGNATAWHVDTDGPVNALLVFSSNLYLAGGFNTTGGNAYGSLSGVDANTGEVLDWQPTPSGLIRSMALTTSGLIALGGDFVTFNPPVTGTNPNPVFTYRPGFALLG